MEEIWGPKVSQATNGSQAQDDNNTNGRRGHG